MALLVVATAGTIGFLIWIAVMGWRVEGFSSGDLLFLALFSIWAVMPYGVLAVVCWKMNASLAQSLIVLVGTAIVVGFPAPVIIDAFFLRPDAQAGFVFLFGPILQFSVIGITYLLAAIAGRIRKAA